LINQVLKDLDKRGATTKIGESTIRVVHMRSQRSAFMLIAAGVAGTLLVGGASWMLWQAQQRPVVVPVAVLPKPVEVLPASQPVAAPVQAVVLKIEGMFPEMIRATGVAQIITINGSNFNEGASVTLRKQGGQEFTKRPVISLKPEQIELKSNFGSKPATWTVEVLNKDGSSSGQYAFEVLAAEKAVRSAAQKSENQSGETRQVASPVAQAATARAQPGTVVRGGINKQPTQISLQQQADNEFRRAYQLMRQGRNTEALAGYEAALKLDAGHEQARQTMVSLLLENKRTADAERVLQEGLQDSPRQTNFAMLLARLQVERNAVPLALETLQRTLPYAGTQPDYLSFVAALLQRVARHKEAVDYYQKALQLKPQNGVWLMGMGISLHAEQRNDEARDAFKHALDSNTLNAELQAYVKQQLKEL